VFPPGPDGIRLGPQIQRGLIRYVRGQLTVSFLIGTSVGIGVYILSLTGVWPDGDQYALILGLWAMVTEVIPYIGPILGALPAIALAAIHSPTTAIWVGLFYLGIHQLEGHVIVPRVMGQALGAHPLLVIFALVAGAELYGIIGAVLSLPLLAMGREVAIFLQRRLVFEPWPGGGYAGAGLDVTVPVRIEPEPPTSA
jgi:predicted PurR-regulated permease PerM